MHTYELYVQNADCNAFFTFNSEADARIIFRNMQCATNVVAMTLVSSKPDFGRLTWAR